MNNYCEDIYIPPYPSMYFSWSPKSCAMSSDVILKVLLSNICSFRHTPPIHRASSLLLSFTPSILPCLFSSLTPFVFPPSLPFFLPPLFDGNMIVSI